MKLIDRPINISFFGVAVRKAHCPTNQRYLMRLVLGARGPFFDSFYGVLSLFFPNATHRCMYRRMKCRQHLVDGSIGPCLLIWGKQVRFSVPAWQVIKSLIMEESE